MLLQIYINYTLNKNLVFDSIKNIVMKQFVKLFVLEISRHRKGWTPSVFHPDRHWHYFTDYRLLSDRLNAIIIIVFTYTLNVVQLSFKITIVMKWTFILYHISYNQTFD